MIRSAIKPCACRWTSIAASGFGAVHKQKILPLRFVEPILVIDDAEKSLPLHVGGMRGGNGFGRRARNLVDVHIRRHQETLISGGWRNV